MGSVTYAIPVKTEEAALGTPILVNDENAVYRYTLASADVANGTGTAMDPTVSQGQPINVAIGSYLPKIVVTIPFIGYLMAATKSIEGLIVLGTYRSVSDYSLCNRRTLEKRSRMIMTTIRRIQNQDT